LHGCCWLICAFLLSWFILSWYKWLCSAQYQEWCGAMPKGEDGMRY
jgi:hypothetical protein